MAKEVPDIEDVPHVDDLEPRSLKSVSYVRDDDTIYRVLPNHEGLGEFDLLAVEEHEDERF